LPRNLEKISNLKRVRNRNKPPRLVERPKCDSSGSTQKKKKIVVRKRRILKVSSVISVLALDMFGLNVPIMGSLKVRP
jgi:hypothetical protein